MEKLKLKVYYPAAFVFLVVLVIAGSYFIFNAHLPPGDLDRKRPYYPEQLF
jgi:hypothetical protein